MNKLKYRVLIISDEVPNRLSDVLSTKELSSCCTLFLTASLAFEECTMQTIEKIGSFDIDIIIVLARCPSDNFYACASLLIQNNIAPVILVFDNPSYLQHETQSDIEQTTKAEIMQRCGIRVETFVIAIGQDDKGINALRCRLLTCGSLHFMEHVLKVLDNISESYTEQAGTSIVECHSEFNKIAKRLQEDTLNLSIVGEFSTGKSTLVNALLKCNLLTASIFQGTTVSSTIIEYGLNYSMTCKYLNRIDSEVTKYTTIEDLRNALVISTTDPEIGRCLESVTITIPADFLKQGIRIIDTPGTNSTEKWHEDVTARAMRNESDLSIVLCHAENALPQTLILFLSEHVADILPRCTFLVTYMDKIEKENRTRLLKWITGRIAKHLGVEDATVLPYSSPLVLSSCNIDFNTAYYNTNTTEDTELLEASLQSERELINKALQNSKEAQLMSLSNLTKSLTDSINIQIDSLVRTLEQDQVKAQHLRSINIDAFNDGTKLIEGKNIGELIARDDQAIAKLITQKSKLEAFKAPLLAQQKYLNTARERLILSGYNIQDNQ